MSDPENFLSRWSQLKLKEETNSGASSKLGSNREESLPEQLGSAADDAAAPFDPATLPAIETIGAGSDIRAFLTPGVPEDLKIAALRRAWSSDPAICEFVGLSEDLGDFNAPETIFGFGSIDKEKIQGLLERVLGSPEVPEAQEAARAGCQSAPMQEQTTRSRTEAGMASFGSEAPALQGNTEPGRLVVENTSQPDRIEAVVQNTAFPERKGVLPSRRRHGGALPE
jgi:hypothetical protein